MSAARAAAEPAREEDVSAILLQQADRLFEQHVTKERLYAAERGEWPAAIWGAVAEAGLPLALVPETQGGYGLRGAEAALLVRRSAYHSAPIPLAESMMAAALWAAAAGDFAEGILTLAPTELKLSRSSGRYRVEGTLSRVPWGAKADRILACARDDGGEAYLVLLSPDEGEVIERRNVAFEPRPGLVFAAALMPEDRVRPAPPLCQEGILPFGALLRSEQMVGAMERCLEYALAYANERKQFGRAIGKFQAVQHLLAEAAGEFAASAAAADGAADAWGNAEFTLAVALAKARVGEAAGKIAAIAHQVHGAMGFTHEHPLHFATRRLWSWRDEFGAEPYWQDQIGRLVCRDGGEALWDTLVQATHAGAGTATEVSI
jgi:acyl-CoA dehydrogenase